MIDKFTDQNECTLFFVLDCQIAGLND